MTSTSQGDQRRQRREEMANRYGEAQRVMERRAKMRRFMMLGAIGAVVLLIGLGLWWAAKEALAPLPGEAIPEEGRTHVEAGAPINYATYPPASGPHFPSTAEWKFYESTVSPGYWVHNLEHGGVVILYKCPEDCAELKTRLKHLYDIFPRSAKYGYPKLLIAPDNQIDGMLTIIAWGNRQSLDTYDEAALRKFYLTFHDHGPEDAA